MVCPDSNWSAGIFQRLELLSKDRIDADVILLVGSRQIPTHKFVLDTNSDMMKADDVYFKVTERMYHVILSEEFGEKFDLLCGLITSLYSGCIEVGEDDAKFVYKFAKVYNVDWLKSKAFALFESMLTESTFIDIFQFSHSICCEDLKGLCLDYLTPNFLHALIKAGELLDIDYHYLCTIINATYSTVLPELEKFRLVCKWFETDVSKRICHLESLISLIRFNNLKKSDLPLVLDWILNDKNIDDSRRVNLMREVNMKANAPILQTSDSSGKPQKLKSCQRTLERIKDTLSQNAGQSRDSIVPFPDFYAVVQNLYSNGDSMTKHIIAEFLNKNFQTMITSDNITDLVRLNRWDFSIFPVIDSLSSEDLEEFRELIPEIEWKDLSFENLHKFVEEMRQIAETNNNGNYIELNGIYIERRIGFLFDVRIVESIMSWALEHPHNNTQIFELMNKSGCLCFLPSEYLNLVLKPYVLMISSGEEVPYQCQKHKWKTVFNAAIVVKGEFTKLLSKERHGYITGSRYKCCLPALTPKIRMMTEDEFIIPGQNCNYYRQFLPKSAGSLFHLSLTCNRGYSRSIISLNPKLILFDKKQCMTKYPVWSTCNLDLNELREIVVTHQNLCTMFFQNVDLSIIYE